LLALLCPARGAFVSRSREAQTNQVRKVRDEK
jgi:hypothetical protein